MGGPLYSDRLDPFDKRKLPDTDLGADPLHKLAYRAALSGADAYGLTRAAVRRDGPILRLGNRFTRLDRFDEIAFLALGRAAISQALAVTEGLGKHLTQGYVAAPDPLPEEVPFHSVRYPTSGPGGPNAEEVAGAAVELSQGLGEKDLLVLLLSAGAFGYLALPPKAEGRDAWVARLGELGRAGMTASEVGTFARLTASGPVAGRLPDGVKAEVVTLVVDRGEGAPLLGGGPTAPVTGDERQKTRAALQRVGMWDLWESSVRTAIEGPSATSQLGANVRRPVVVAEPADALRDGSEAVGEKRWWPRLAELRNPLPAPAAADRFLARVDELSAAEESDDGKGIVVFGPVSFGLLEGVDERPAIAAFLTRASEALRHRDVTVAVARTAGAPMREPAPAGGVVSARVPSANIAIRPIPLRPGITDVGAIATAVVPRRGAS